MKRGGRGKKNSPVQDAEDKVTVVRSLQKRKSKKEKTRVLRAPVL